MAADDVALAWVRMHDDEVRQRVEADDLDALGELSLTEEEQGLVRRLASELRAPAEVETFETSATFQAMNAGWGKLSPEVLEELSAQLRADEGAAEVQGYGLLAGYHPLGVTSTKTSTGQTDICAPGGYPGGTGHCGQAFHSGGLGESCY